MVQEDEISEGERLKSEYYDLVGGWNLPLVRPGGISDTDQLLEMCEIDTGSKVLEMGCGAGFTSCRIAELYGSHVRGIDRSQNMIASAKRRAKEKKVDDLVDFNTGDVMNLEFDDGFFDVVIMESFLNILGEPELIQKALEEISRVVRQGGRVVVNEMFADEKTPPKVKEYIQEHLNGLCGPGGNLARYSPTEFSNWFEGAGLHVVRIVKKPASTMRSDLAKSLIKEMGLFGFFTFTIKASRDMLSNKQLRGTTRKAASVQRVMERNKDTRDYFGYMLLLSEKA